MVRFSGYVYRGSTGLGGRTNRGHSIDGDSSAMTRCGFTEFALSGIGGWFNVGQGHRYDRGHGSGLGMGRTERGLPFWGAIIFWSMMASSAMNVYDDQLNHHV